jgi:chromatin remodeling complex protein RSC6
MARFSAVGDIPALASTTGLKRPPLRAEVSMFDFEEADMGALDKKYKPSALLATIIGQVSITRGQATKMIWDYFKSHKLNAGREISADDRLRPLFGKDKINMFEVGKILNGHLTAE